MYICFSVFCYSNVLVLFYSLTSSSSVSVVFNVEEHKVLKRFLLEGFVFSINVVECFLSRLSMEPLNSCSRVFPNLHHRQLLMFMDRVLTILPWYLFPHFTVVGGLGWPVWC